MSVSEDRQNQDLNRPSLPLMTRRRLLGSAAGMAIAAATGLMPPNLRRVLADGPAARGSLKDIKHVVLLMMENRSFDHYFGTMAGVRGFGDAAAIKGLSQN
jgi:phospholipase C